LVCASVANASTVAEGLSGFSSSVPPPPNPEETHLVVAAEALVAPAVLVDDGGEPPVMGVVLPPHACQQGRGEDAFPDGLRPHARFDHPLRCLGL